MRKVVVTGVNKTILGIRKVEKRVYRNLNRGLHKCADVLLEKSRELCPVDKGDLFLSGKVSKKVSPDGLPRYEVGYGALNDDGHDYAIYVHEDLDALHGAAFNADPKHAAEIAAGKTHPRREQEQAKFLEQPARQSTPEFRAIVLEEMQKSG